MNLEDILAYGVGGALAIPTTALEIKGAENVSGILLEDARTDMPTFGNFMKYFVPVEAGKNFGTYLAQDQIDQPFMENLLHGLTIGNLGLDFVFFVKPSWYRKLVELTPV